jgi:hypothetical protein
VTGTKRLSADAEVNLNDPDADFREPEPTPFILPPWDAIERQQRIAEAAWSYPSELFDQGGREKVAFGTTDVVLSVYQARRRKLLKYAPLFRGYVRSCRDRRAEDTLLTKFDRKQAAKATAVAPQSA